VSTNSTETGEASTHLRGRADRITVGIVSITVLAVLLRFPTLMGQSYWGDEMVTVDLVERSLGDMLATIPNSENTPPLYYLVAWGWSHVFGTGEFGLRSLSALCGVAMVPVVYLIFRDLSPRVGLIAALLTAVNPFLIWYSQEARSYALFALMGAISLLFFVRALESPSRKSVTWWGGSSALALLSHYGAGFLVGAEALVLLITHRRRVDIRWASVVVAAVGAALLPLAIHQRDNTTLALAWIGEHGLLERIRAIPNWFAWNSIDSSDGIWAGKLVVALCLAVGLGLFLTRAIVRERSFGLILLGVALLALTASLAMAAFGVDVVVARNLIGLWPAAIAVFAIGLGTRAARGLGPLTAAALVVVGVGFALFIATDQSRQRPAWDDAAEKLEGSRGPTALVAAPVGHLEGPFLERYGLATEQLPALGAEVRNVAALYVKPNVQPVDHIPSAVTANAHDQMQVVTIQNFHWFVLVRLRSTRPVSLTSSDLRGLPPKLFSCCGPRNPFGPPFVALISDES
jgi:mannosyltransferase